MFQFERCTPEEVGIPSSAVMKFLDRVEMTGIELHSIMMLRHGKVFAEGWWRPFAPNLKHSMFSFTKSLLSTAIGFAEQEGKLSLDERVADILSDKISEKTSEQLKRATIADFLKMSCGQHTEPGFGGQDWARDFFAQEAPHEPGSYFLYNTAGTNVLCLVLLRKTGENLFDYLRPRLFDKIGMAADIDCSKLADGTDMGGAGSRLHTEDMARFMTFVANKGMWQGEQLLRREWFERATAAQIDSTNNQPPQNVDWLQGYCYQYWRCAPEGSFRADGAFGQFGIVLEKQDAVIIITQCNDDPQVSLSLLWENILPAMGDEPLPASDDAEALKTRLGRLMLRVFPRSRQFRTETVVSGKLYTAQSDISVSAFLGGLAMGAADRSPKLEKIGLEFGDSDCFFVVVAGGDTYKLPFCPFGYLKAGGEVAGEKYAFGGRWRANGVFELENRILERIGGVRYILRFDSDGVTVERDSVAGFAPPASVPLRFSSLSAS